MNRTSVLVGALISLALAIGIASGSLVLGSDEGRWFFLYVRPFELRLLVAPILASLAAIGLLRVRVPDDRREWILVFAWIVVATGLHVLLRSAVSYSLESLFVSDAANSFYGMSKQFEPSEVLRHFNRVRLQTHWHAVGNMPGKVLLVYGLRLVSDRTDVLPWLVVIVSNLGAALMYWFVRDLLADRRAALLSAVLYLFTPARIFFFPILNTVTPVLVLLCASLCLRWLRSGTTGWAAALGLALYALAFFEPLPLVMGLLGIALALGEIAAGRLTWSRLVVQSAVAVAAFIAASEAVYASTGFEIVRAFRQLREQATGFNATEGRPYWIWVRRNLIELLVGVGGCQAALFCTTVLGPTRGWRERMASPIAALGLELMAVLVTLDLVGVNRGEVIRLWIFLACFLQIPTAYVCSTLGSRAEALVVACTILPAGLGLAMIGFVVP